MAGAANELGVNPESIDLADPKWGRVLEGEVDAKTGQRVPMSRYEWIRTVRTDATYGFDRTPKARQEAAQLVEKLYETFGRTG